MNGGVISPIQYQEWKPFAREVDLLEQVSVLVSSNNLETVEE